LMASLELITQIISLEVVTQSTKADI
jgi:hypothetical protein